MKRVLCPKLPAPGHSVPLPENEAHHAVQVFRLKDGDRVEALDGQGGAVVAILRNRAGAMMLEFEKPVQKGGSETLPIRLEMSVLKGDAMEWVVEKAVELGVETFVPVVTAHTVVQLERKGEAFFQARWQRIADQSLKQCGRLNRMEVALPVTLETLLAGPKQARYWCDEEKESGEFLGSLDYSAVQSVSLLIGPEGGWSFRERDLLRISGGARVSLGPLVLRAETAAIFAISVAVAGLRRGR